MDSWEGRQTLVTGGGGFIGGHLAVALNRAGARVRAFCRYNSRGDPGTLGWFQAADTSGIEVIFGDLRDLESIQHATRGAEVVFHLGAQISIPYSYVNPRDFIETNVGGTLNVAQAAMNAGVRRVLHISTSEVYGDARAWPITESHPVAPRSPYAASKVGADMLMYSLHHSHALAVTIARPFNTYGPHQSVRAIVPTIATQAICGGPLRLGRIDTRRDLTFVRDTVKGLIAIAGTDASLGRTVQIGSGEDVSVNQLVELIGELVGRKLEVEFDPKRVRPADSEIERLVCDHGVATALAGWTPTTDLRTGLAETLAWIGDNLHRYDAAEYAI